MFGLVSAAQTRNEHITTHATLVFWKDATVSVENFRARDVKENARGGRRKEKGKGR
jgi:hypothetical protein